jgi:ankyrin repeat protein
MISVTGLALPCRWGRTPLHWAALNGHRRTLELCIALGGNVNACLPDKIQERRTRLVNETALHLATRLGRADIAAVLLSHGADPAARDSLGNRPGEVHDPRLARDRDLTH